jgi:hypothetical protein
VDELEQRRIARALATLAADDPDAAQHAEAALDWLTAGEGLAGLSQLFLQDFLFYRLPTRWMVGVAEHLEVADALGRLLALLGYERYAAICHAPDTRELLATWAVDERRARRWARKAQRDSGVEPPDIDELTWGQMMGLTEATAQATVADALEAAIDTGELVPVARGWRGTQAEVTRRTLLTGHPRDEGTWLDRVEGERIGHWRSSRSDARAELLDAAVPDLTTPVDVPADAEVVVAPVRYLLDHAREGLALTGTHRLTPAFVTQMAEHFDWWAPGTRREEDDVTEVARTREIAEDLGAVRRRKARLHLTPRGRQLVDDPAALWRAVTAHLATGHDLGAVASALAYALLLARGERHWLDLYDEVRELLALEGWRDSQTHEPVDRMAVQHHLAPRLARDRLLGIVAESGAGADRRIALTSTGRSTARAALRAAATAPRD